ncbi:hypothetical protein O6H91_10G087600 [Diphasiastrum complanatum]|uniref:Uncharacterized protein n=1 Tax=Diphasiastrum complanatum TaxID=34168 RepID=A0ACC2CJD4_DIPCM|nr:hypothetical protein O6H91_10G087600 [Diphasiastrum complanatum]
MDSAVASEIADTTTTTPVPAAKKTTVLKKFKNLAIAVMRAPGKLISFAGKEKPPKAVVEENVTAGEPTVEVVPKEVEQSSVTAEKDDAKETEVIAEKVEPVVKEPEAATGTEKEVAASSDPATKSSVVA